MTDEAPKQLWAMCTACNNWDEPIASPHRVDHFHEYLRADHALALVAEAYGVAGEECRKLMLSLSNDIPAVEHTDVDTCIILRDRIRALTPADAQAARDARDAEVRRKALEEAAAMIDRKIKAVQPEMTRRAQRLAEGKKPGFQYAIHRADLNASMSDRDLILALIEKGD